MAINKLLIMLFMTVLVTPPVFALDFLQSIDLAYKNNAQFKVDYGNYLAISEHYPIARGQLLPQADFIASRSRYFNEKTSKHKSHLNETVVQLSLSQALFDYTKFYALKGAKAEVNVAKAQFLAAKQQLLMDTATAYFSVLKAKHQLDFLEAEQEAAHEYAKEIKHRFKQGMVSIADVHEVKANEDRLNADRIAAQNTLADAKESFQEVIGMNPSCLMDINNELPLARPEPTDIQTWAKTAGTHNYLVVAANFARDQALAAISALKGGHMPVISASGGWIHTQAKDDSSGQLTEQVPSIGVAFRLPLSRGGSTVAAVNQATYQYRAANANLNKIHGAVMANTRRAYRGVITMISKIQADKQMILSAQSAYSTRLASYRTGISNLTQLLKAQSDLYAAKTHHDNDQYDYLLNLMALKQQAGLLSIQDFHDVSQWLSQRVILDKLAEKV